MAGNPGLGRRSTRLERPHLLSTRPVGARPGAGISSALVALMAAACGLSVANLYYNQPLLREMADTFGTTAGGVGSIPLLTQAGYATGMLLFVPLGDLVERRRLIVRVSLAVAACLVVTAAAPNLPALACASFVLGAATVVPQLLVPFAADLAPDESRGRVVGTVMGGLLLGVLLARTASGALSDAFGWRAVYGCAAVVMVGLAAVLRAGLPVWRPRTQVRYREVLPSLWHIARTEPDLREAAVYGACSFAAFSAFWSTLVFFVAEPPYGYGARAAGLFGLVGAAGAAIAPVAGRLADRRGSRFAVALALSTLAASFVVLGAAGRNLLGLVVGIVLLDVGSQGNQVANQARIYGIAGDARNRLNTVYMVTYFIGGATGTALGVAAWTHLGWAGVCATGLAATAVAGTVFLVTRRR